MWLGLLVSTTKTTYNHSVWNLFINIYLFIIKLFLLYLHSSFIYY
jgi:hypothetical protein